MRVALFRMSKRQQWVERLRQSGYEAKFVHDPDRITLEMNAIVIDTAVGKWKDYVRLLQHKGVPIVLLVERKETWTEEQADSFGIAGTVTEAEDTEGLFATCIRAGEAEEETPASFPTWGGGLMMPVEDEPVQQAANQEAMERQERTPAVPLSQRKTRKKTDAEPVDGTSLFDNALSSLERPGPSDEPPAFTLPANGQADQADRERHVEHPPPYSLKEPEVESVEPVFPNPAKNRVELPTPTVPRVSADFPSTVAVYAAKGGVGNTTFLLHVAMRAAKEGFRVCVLDLNPDGTLAATLHMLPHKTIQDLAFRLDDRKASRACLLQTKLGFSLVAAPLQPHAFQLQPEELGGILRFLKEEHELVLVDLPVHMDGLTKLALEQMEQLFLMTMDEPASLIHLERMKPFFASLRPAPEMAMVWNRLLAPAPKADWKERLPWPVVLELPEEPSVREASWNGEWRTSSLCSPYRLQVNRLVDRWMGREPEAPDPKRNWLRSLLSIRS